VLQIIVMFLTPKLIKNQQMQSAPKCVLFLMAFGALH